MLPFNTRVVAVSDSSDDLSVFGNAQNVSEAEIASSLITLGVHAGLEGCEQGTAGVHVGFQLSALLVAEQCRIRQDQRFIFLEILRPKVVLMHEIEKEAA